MNENNIYIINGLREAIGQAKLRGAWDRGVAAYEIELLDEIEEYNNYCTRENKAFNIPKTKNEFEKICLNGAKSWYQYSHGGCSLVSNYEIVKRLCCPSTLKRKKNGELRPNNHEEWLDVQTRALKVACRRLFRDYLNCTLGGRKS